MATTIRNEMRVDDNGKPEIWTNLGDILDWLQSLPQWSNNRVAAGAALEIREMLLDQIGDAEHVKSSKARPVTGSVA